MKFTTLLPLAFASLQYASAFAPRQRTFSRPAAVASFMAEEADAVATTEAGASEPIASAPAPAVTPATTEETNGAPPVAAKEEEEAEVAPAPPAPVVAVPAPAVPAAASKATAETGGKLVAIKEETVEFTAGLIGGVAGLAVGGPVLAAFAAAATNYVSKSDGEAAVVVSAVSKKSIEAYNYLANLDSKYEILGSARDRLQSALDKLKAQENVDPDAVRKVEAALASTKTAIDQVNDEYDLVNFGMTALGVVGDLIEKTVVTVGELSEQYQLTDRAKEALSSAVEKAKDAAADANAEYQLADKAKSALSGAVEKAKDAAAAGEPVSSSTSSDDGPDSATRPL